jgi:hypothetical protein
MAARKKIRFSRDETLLRAATAVSIQLARRAAAWFIVHPVAHMVELADTLL